MARDAQKRRQRDSPDAEPEPEPRPRAPTPSRVSPEVKVDSLFRPAGPALTLSVAPDDWVSPTQEGGGYSSPRELLGREGARSSAAANARARRARGGVPFYWLPLAAIP